MLVTSSRLEFNRYKRLNVIGEGTYGLVFAALDTFRLHKRVAIKKIKLAPEDEGIPTHALREISLMGHLNHPNILKPRQCIFLNCNAYLVFDLMHMDLKKALMKLPRNKYYEGKVLKKMLRSLTEAVEYCHSRRIMHRDIKPQNVLLTKNLDIKLTDFGLAREHKWPIGAQTLQVVTLWYRAPEIFLGLPEYSSSCDVWSLACVFLETATKRLAFAGATEIEHIFQVFKLLGTPTERDWQGVESLKCWNKRFPKWRKQNLGAIFGPRVDPTLLSLLEEMWLYSPNKRITAKRILKHKWFNSF